MLPNCPIDLYILRRRPVGGVKKSISARSVFRYKEMTIRAKKRDTRSSPDIPVLQY